MLVHIMSYRTVAKMVKLLVQLVLDQESGQPQYS